MKLIQKKLIAVLLCPSLVVSFASKPQRSGGRLYLDSADYDEWNSLLETGIFRGVTTNPSLLEKCKQPCTVENLNKMAEKALEFTEEFFCQAWGSTADEIYERAMLLSKPDKDRITIKVPLHKEGVLATKRLRKSGVRVCLTACYSAKQAMVACGVGANYIAPHWERITAAGRDGYDETIQIKEIIDSYGGNTRVLVASILNADSMARLASEGLNSFAMPAFVVEDMFIEPLTAERAAEFEGAAVRGSSISEKLK